MCCRAKTCCGCCGLSVGVYIVAVFSIIIAASYTGIAAYGLKALLQSGGGDAKTIGTATGFVLFYGFWLLSAFFLIIAACKKVKGLLIPWMVCTGFILVLFGIVVIISILALVFWGMMEPYVKELLQSLQSHTNQSGVGFSQEDTEKLGKTMTSAVYFALIVSLVMSILIFALWIYGMVVVCSYYRELRDEEAPSQGYQMTSSYEQPPAYTTKDPYQRV